MFIFNRLVPVIVFLVTAVYAHAQNDSLGRVQYSPDFRFRDGVYISFDEWKNNHPRIKDFREYKTNTFGAQDEIELHYSCRDTAGVGKSCVVKSCFGFVRDGSFYISQGFNGYYFKVFIIGGLTHFLAFTNFGNQEAYISSEPNGFMGSANDFREYVLDFNSGQSFQFTYKNFAVFLKENDTELYQKLMDAKNKRQMIHHYLLEYNKRHPVYFPAK
jgi:hypothetical protein